MAQSFSFTFYTMLFWHVSFCWFQLFSNLLRMSYLGIHLRDEFENVIIDDGFKVITLSEHGILVD